METALNNYVSTVLGSVQTEFTVGLVGLGVILLVYGVMRATR